MNNIIRKALIILVLVVANIFSAQAEDTLEILTFNIYGAPNSDWPMRLEIILDELERIQPDIIGFQEVVETPGMNGMDNRAKAIADSLLIRTGISYKVYWQRTHFSWDIFDEGIAIMTKYNILEKDYINLPPGVFPRKTIWARISTPIGIIDFFNTHISYGSQQQIRNLQVSEIKDFISQKTADSVAALSILSGDFNSAPAKTSIQMLVRHDSTGIYFQDSWNINNPNLKGYTFPSDKPNDKIDYIFFANNEWGDIVKSQLLFQIPNVKGIYPSDHLGVLSKFCRKSH